MSAGVNVDIEVNGAKTPRSVRWHDGRTFPIRQVLDRMRARPRSAGPTALRYTVRIGSRITYLWEDDQHLWFVEERGA